MGKGGGEDLWMKTQKELKDKTRIREKLGKELEIGDRERGGK